MGTVEYSNRYAYDTIPFILHLMLFLTFQGSTLIEGLRGSFQFSILRPFIEVKVQVIRKNYYY